MVMASICSVTFIVPNCAAYAVATFPVIKVAVSKGAISLAIPTAKSPPISLDTPIPVNCEAT